MKRLGRYLLAMMFVMLTAAPVLTLAAPQPAQAACNESGFLGIPPWYRGLTRDEGANGCGVLGPGDVGGLENYIWRIVLNIIEIIIVITGYVAFFFIVYGGFQYMTGGSNPSQLESARKTILNAIIGLAISLGSIAIINFVFGIFGNVDRDPATGGLVRLTDQQLLGGVVGTISFIAGTVAIITIIIGGLNYVTASGDPAKLGRAKNLVLYSVVGLVLVFAASAITQFVIGRFN